MIGVGEQSSALFADPYFEALGVRHVRYVVGWDALRTPWSRAEVDQWMAAAHAANVDVLLAFNVSRDATRHVDAEQLPAPGSVFLHVDWSFTAPVKPGDEITATAEVLEVRADKPICRLRTTITKQDGTVVLDGTALVYQETLAP